MTKEQIDTKIDKMRFTYLGRDEEFNLKKVLTGINGLATGAIWGGITGSIGDQTDLISDGKILSSLLPALAITDTNVVSSEAAMLALTAETGDIAVRTDETKTYILKGTDPSVLADWELLLTPTGGVVSVFGRSGAVTAQSGDYSFSLISGTASPTQGGTGLATYAKGDVLIATGTNTVGVVGASATDGDVFTWDAASGLPMWKAASGGGGGGITALAAIGSVPNANAATISGSTLNLQPASTSYGGVITTGAQSFAGAKTFMGLMTVNSGTNTTLPSLAGYEGLIVQRSNSSAYGVNLSLIAGATGPSAVFFGSTSTQNLGSINYSGGTNGALTFATAGTGGLFFKVNGSTMLSASSSSVTASGSFGVSISSINYFSVNSSLISLSAPASLTVNSAGFKGADFTNNNASGVCSLDFFNDSGGNGYFRVYGSSYLTPRFQNNVSFGSKRSVYIVSGASGLLTGDNIYLGAGPLAATYMTVIGDSGNILIGTQTDEASSILTLSSTTKGFLPPRMTTTQKTAITSPTEGLVVYDNVLHKLCVYTGSAWETIASA